MSYSKIDQDTCTTCEACVSECGSKAITAVDGIVAVDATNCDVCGGNIRKCAEVCPTDSITLED